MPGSWVQPRPDGPRNGKSRRGRNAACVAAAAGIAAVACFGGFAAAEPDTARVAAALRTITDSVRPGEVGYAFISNETSYLECHRLPDGDLLCGAAGPAFPSALQAATAERRHRLADLGWGPDPCIGVLMQIFPDGMDAEAIAAGLVATLAEAGVTAGLQIAIEWEPEMPCPPEEGASGTRDAAVAASPPPVRT